MLTRRLTAACLTAALFLEITVAVPGSARAGGPEFTIYGFGDSLTDTGNLFALTGGAEPPDHQYFDGRFSNGPVWIEYFAELADGELENYAVGGAFSDTRGEALDDTGLLSQVGGFLTSGGTIQSDDLTAIWVGANNYFGGDVAPNFVVADIAEAVTTLAAATDAGRFLVLNLPDLGDTPAGRASIFASALGGRVGAHNRLLALAMAGLRVTLGVDIVVVDINTAFADLLTHPEMFGLDNTTDPCLIQQDDGTRFETELCLHDDGDLDFGITGVFFWDLIHPTTQVHAVIAMTAHTALTMSESLLVASGD